MSEGNHRDFIDEIRREHDELRELLGQIHNVLTQRNGPASQVAAQMDSLSNHIEHHFADEEKEGYFEQVRTRAPRFAQQLDILKHEHETLLQAVRSLQADAKVGDCSPEWWERMDDAFHAFSKDLMHHETNENELVQEAYTEDIGTGD